MHRLTLTLIFVTTLSLAQTQLDYKLYSMVIDSRVNEWKDHYKIEKVIVIKKFKPEQNDAAYFGKDFLTSDEGIVNMTIHYDTLLMTLIKDKNVREGLIKLESEFYETPVVEADRFRSKTRIVTMTNRRQLSYFRTLFGRYVVKGWERFNKKNPGTLGFYELSKIVHVDHYALFYIGHHGGSLFGTGDIVILTNVNGPWEILTYMNIWTS
jgi:hypothetical protein